MEQTTNQIVLCNAFKDEYTNAHHLLSSVDFKNNIKDHLPKIGVDEANVRLILIDLFGEQIGTRFEEGTVDAENGVDFEESLGSLCDIRKYRLVFQVQGRGNEKMHHKIGENSFWYG